MAVFIGISSNRRRNLLNMQVAVDKEHVERLAARFVGRIVVVLIYGELDGGVHDIFEFIFAVGSRRRVEIPTHHDVVFEAGRLVGRYFFLNRTRQ